MAMNKTIKYSATRNIVFASKIEEQKKLEKLLREKYKQLNNKNNVRTKTN
jgi:hypothetical protein